MTTTTLDVVSVRTLLDVDHVTSLRQKWPSSILWNVTESPPSWKSGRAGSGIGLACSTARSDILLGPHVSITVGEHWYVSKWVSKWRIAVHKHASPIRELTCLRPFSPPGTIFFAPPPLMMTLNNVKHGFGHSGMWCSEQTELRYL